MFAIGSVGQAGVAVGRKVLLAAVGSAAVDAAPIHIEALIFRPEPFRTEMPFTGQEGRVTAGLQCLGQRRLVQRQPVGIRCRQVAGIALPFLGLGRADVIRDTRPLRPFAREQARARRRTDRTGGICASEPGSIPRHAVEVRCLVKGAAVAAEIAPAQIVGQEQDDVGLLRRERGDAQNREQRADK